MYYNVLKQSYWRLKCLYYGSVRVSVGQETRRHCLNLVSDQFYLIGYWNLNVFQIFAFLYKEQCCLYICNNQSCQVFTTKPAQLLLKTSPMAFLGRSPAKNCILGGKVHVFWQGSHGKISIAGAKYHVIGVASTYGHEKQPAIVLK